MSRRQERPEWGTRLNKQRLAVSVVMLGAAASANAGVNTWTAIGPEGGDVRKVVMHPTQPDTAVAIASSGVYRTVNGATSWTKSAQQFQNPPYDLQVDPSDPNRVYVLSFSNPPIVVSTDGGATFGPLPNLPVATPVEPRLGLGKDGVMYFGTELRVFRSADRGASWTARDPIVLPAGARIRWLVVDPLDPNTVYALVDADAAPPALFVSWDGAATWTQRTVKTKLVPSPAVSGELWSAQDDGLWKSADYAATWTNVGFPTGVSDLALNVRDGNALDIIVSVVDGAFRSVDSGGRWSDITGDLWPSMRRVTAHPVDPERIIFSGLDGISVPGASPGTWVSGHSGIIATSVRKFAADASTDKIYAFTGRIHVSASGAEYLPVNDRALATFDSLPPRTLLTTIHAQPGSLLALLSIEVARSNDGGASWSLIPASWAERPPQLWQLASAAGEPANLIAKGAPGAFRSADAGASWTRIAAGLPDGFETFDIEFAESDPSVVYFGPSSHDLATPQPQSQALGVYRSTDGGTSWAPANGGIETLGAYDIEVDPTDSRIVYAIAGTTFVKSTDSGGTWRTLRQSVSSFARIAIDPVLPRSVYIVSDLNSVLRSVDGGESFETVLSSAMSPWWHPQSVIVDPRRSNVVSVGTEGFGVQQMSIEPDLELRLTAPPSTAAPGATLSSVLFATNRGPFASSGSRVTIQFSAGLADVTATSQGGTCTAQQNAAVCTLNPLAMNASIGITLTAAAPSSGSATVNASVQGDQPDPVASNNAVSFSIDVAPAATPNSPVPPSGSGGGGGGGATSLLLLLLAALARGLPSRLRARMSARALRIAAPERV
jgi:hypothetical protein